MPGLRGSPANAAVQNSGSAWWPAGLYVGDDISAYPARWRDLTPEARDILRWGTSPTIEPHADNIPENLRGRPVASLPTAWVGGEAQGHPYVDRALSLCQGDTVTKGTMFFLDLQTMADFGIAAWPEVLRSPAT